VLLLAQPPIRMAMARHASRQTCPDGAAGSTSVISIGMRNSPSSDRCAAQTTRGSQSMSRSRPRRNRTLIQCAPAGPRLPAAWPSDSSLACPASHQKPAPLHGLPVAGEPARALTAAKRAGLTVPGDRVGNPRAQGEGEEGGEHGSRITRTNTRPIHARQLVSTPRSCSSGRPASSHPAKSL